MNKLFSSVVNKLILPLLRSNLVTWSFRARLYGNLGARIGRGSLVGYGCDVAGDIRHLAIGNNSYLNCHGYLQLEAPICIGNDVRIAAFIRILTRWHPIEKASIRRRLGRDRDIPCKIGDGCWIGLGVTILPGVNIAEGCVISAGAVVTRSTEPNGLYAGVPAVRKKDLPIDEGEADLLIQQPVAMPIQ